MMATETHTSSVAWPRTASTDLGKTGLPRLKTSDVNVQSLLSVNNDLSALSCSSAVSQIIGGYMYTPMTPKPPQEEGKLQVEKEEGEEEEEEEEETTPVQSEDMFKNLGRVLSTTSMEVPFALLLDDMPAPDILTPKEFSLKRQSGVRRNSKLSMRLSQLQTMDTGSLAVPRVFATASMAEDSPIDWAPIQRLMPRDPKQPMSAISPMSCITDAFTDEERWSCVRPDDDQDRGEVFENHLVGDEEEEDCQSCTDVLSPCETITSWDGVTIIDDVSQVSQQDYGKEVVPRSPVVSCRIDSVVNFDFPEFMPADDEEEEVKEMTPPTRQFESISSWGTIEVAPLRPQAPAAPPVPQTAAPTVPRKAGTDPLSISRQVMRQEWTETPPMKIDMAKLESMVPARIPTPNNNGRASPMPWLVSRSSSPARSLEKRKNSPEPVKRVRSPRGWRLW